MGRTALTLAVVLLALSPRSAPTDLATGTAAGMVVSAPTVLSVLIYAAAVWTWRVLVPAPRAAAEVQ